MNRLLGAAERDGGEQEGGEQEGQWSSELLCNVSVANVHPSRGLLLHSMRVRSAAPAEPGRQPWLLTHTTFPASLPPHGVMATPATSSAPD